ncbi:MAG TPA: hypothetical protein PK685_02125 [archaeon]|nr:hypothetical protein [archaeon]
MNKKSGSIALILLTSKNLNKELVVVSKKLKQADPKQDIYPEKSFHCTIKEVTQFNGSPNQTDIKYYIKQIDSVINKINPFEIEVNGVSNFPNVVIAKVYSKNKKLHNYHNLFCKVLPSSFPKFEKANYIPHITLNHIVSDSQKILEEAKKYKTQNFGKMVVTEIILAKFYPSFSGKITVLKKYKLK